MKHERINNAGVMLECLSNGGTEGCPLVIVPGLFEGVDDWRDFVRFVFPRPAHVISLRGRGGSDAPASGYAMADHVGDIRALIEHCGLRRFNLLGYSRGVSYALATLAGYRKCINFLVLGDYPARH
ncbi:MAG: alpha/beta fold hydrolase, partial [Paracoccaceae bacterium]